LYEAKHGADFVLRSFDLAGGQPAKMITSVGSFQNDHMWWGQPENQDNMPMLGEVLLVKPEITDN
jgi:hypothetical protein